jgi:hypothetical protein
MKHLLIIILVFYSAYYINAQSLGVSAGYGLLNMKDVNDNYKNWQAENPSDFQSMKEVNNGLFFEGNFKYYLGEYNIGLTGNYIESSGEINLDLMGIPYTQTLNVSTIELLGLFEPVFSITETKLKLFIQLAGGIGFASAKREDDVTLIDASSSYFAGRIKAGLLYDLKDIILELSLGYRFANAGEMKATVNIPNLGDAGIIHDWTWQDIYGNSLKFDYSGLLISAGISFKL